MARNSKGSLVIGIIIGIVVMVVVIIGLFATNSISFNSKNNDDSEEKTTNKEDKVDEQSETNEDNAQLDNERYASIIEEYKKAMNDENFDSSSSKYANINNIMVKYYHNYKNGNYEGEFALKYSFYDINSDGKNELIVITSSQNYKYNIADIYTYDGNKPVVFIGEACLGERCSAEIYDNGIIYFYGSGGAMIHGLDFYKIASDGYSKETYKSYSVEYDSNRNVTITDNNTKSVTTYKTDEEVISSVVGNSKKVDLSKLNWIEIE